MKGKLDEGVLHVPTGRRGVVTTRQGSGFDIQQTTVKFDGGKVEELPDVDLKLDSDDGSMRLLGLYFTKLRELPAGAKLTVVNNGDGTVSLIGEAPGHPPMEVHGLQPMGGVVGVSSLDLFPIRF